MKKALILTIILIVLGGVLYYIGFGVVYYFSMKDANERSRQLNCEEQIQQEFDGDIEEVERYEYDSFMNENFFGFKIKSTDTAMKSLSYHFILKENKELLDVVNVGQHIKKEKGKDTFILLTDTNEIKRFKVPDCK